MDCSITENAFIRELVAGNVLAWADFQNRYARVVERAIRSVTLRFPRLITRDDEQEIYATVCVRLIENDKRKLRTFDPGRGHSFNGWLGMVAVQASYDYLRSRRRQQGVDLDSQPEPPASEPSYDPYENYLAQQRSRIAKSLVDRLSSRDREFLALYLRDREPEEIASSMGISVATVYTKKHKINGHLSKLAHKLGLARERDIAA